MCIDLESSTPPKSIQPTESDLSTGDLLNLQHVIDQYHHTHTNQIKLTREDYRKMVQPTNHLLLLRAPSTEEESREVLTIEQFRAAVKDNSVEMFNILNKELAMNKVTIT